MSKIELNANLIKKYHQELVFNYSEYPTKNNWDYKFNDKEYKDSLVDWIGKNEDKPILFMFTLLFANNFATFAYVVRKLQKITKMLKITYIITFLKR